MRALIIRLAIFAICVIALLYADALLDFLSVQGSGGELLRAILQSFVWLSSAFVVVSAVNQFFWDGVVARYAGRAVPALLKNAFAVVIIGVAITGIIAIVFRRDVTAVWATSGVVGIVLGFALRGMIQDIFTGIALNLDGSIKAGDWILLHHADYFLGTEYGEVVEITWRTTRVRLESNNIVVVPNSVMGTIAVTNFGQADYPSRQETQVVIDFNVPPERARRILVAGAAAVIDSGVLRYPPPSVVVGEPEERGITYTVRYWTHVSRYSPVVLRDIVMSSVLNHLRVAGLTPAYPKQDMFHARLPKRLLDHDSVEDRMEVLSRVDLFGRTLSPSELRELAASVTMSSYEEGATLVEQDAAGGSMFVVVEGVLDVLAKRPGSGERRRVGKVAAGEIFGEMSLLTGERRSASVVAGTGAVVYEIKHEHFEAILKARPEIAEEISELVAARRLRTDAAMRDVARDAFDVESRRLKEQILVRMKAAFVLILGPADSQKRTRPERA